MKQPVSDLSEDRKGNFRSTLLFPESYLFYFFHDSLISFVYLMSSIFFCSCFSSNIRWSMVVCLLCSHLLVRVKVGTGSWSVASLQLWESVLPLHLSPFWASWSGSGSVDGAFPLVGILQADGWEPSRETGWKNVKLEKTSSVHGPGQSCLLDLFFLLPVYSWSSNFLVFLWHQNPWLECSSNNSPIFLANRAQSLGGGLKAQVYWVRGKKNMVFQAVLNAVLNELFW